MVSGGLGVLEHVFTLHRLLESAVRHAGDLLLYSEPGFEVSYSVFALRVERLAAALQGLGVVGGSGRWVMGDRVATLDWNTLWHFEAYFAVPMMGAVLHPVNVRLAPLEIVYVLNHARDKVLIVNSDFLGLVERIASRLKYVEHVIVVGRVDGVPDRIGGLRVHYYDDLVGLRGGFEWPWLHEDTVALMSYTSGTTGSPKGVYHTHRQVLLHAVSVAIHLSALLPEGYRAGKGSVFMHIVPMFHAYGWGLPYVATLLAAGQVFPGRFNAERYVELIAERGVTHTAGVPTVLKMLLETPAAARYREALRGLVFMSGGSAMPRGLAEKAVREYGLRLVASYGMTETAPVLTISAVAGGGGVSERVLEKLHQTAGLPLPFAVIETAGEGGVGEVRVRAPWAPREYYLDPEKTREAWREGWFHTGDIGFFDEQGYLNILDRAKDIIKSGGEWISSIRLESLLSTHPCISEAAVVAARHSKWQERPVAFIVPGGCEVSESEVLRHLERFVEEGVIPKWWLPDRIVFVKELPKTSVGKIDKKRLRRDYEHLLVLG